MQVIIGLSGYARSGKDETANILVKQYGFVRVAFADKLREVLYQINPPTWRYHNGMKQYLEVQQVIDEYGWDGYKDTDWNDHIRQMLQRLGTEAGRQTLWDSIWVDAAFANLDKQAKIVVTDVRFPNEAEAVKDRRGFIWRVHRPGVGPANSHASETGLDHWQFDRHIHNDGSLDDLRRAVRDAWEG